MELDFERVENIELRKKIMDPIEVVKEVIPRKGTIAHSGLGQIGSPKIIPECLAKYVEETGEKFELNVYTSGSAAPELDGSLAKIGAIKRRYTYQNNPHVREKINSGYTQYMDILLGEFGYYLMNDILNDLCGPIDVAIIEATKINKDGSIVPSLSLDIIPILIKKAKKIIIEVNATRPPEIEGIHDVYLPESNKPIPITDVKDRIGTTHVKCDLDKIAGIVITNKPESRVFYGKPTWVEEKIVENLFDFLQHEISKGKIPKSLYPLETGIGPIGDLIPIKLTEYEFKDVKVWTEVAQISYLDPLDNGVVTGISGTVLYMPPEEKEKSKRFVENAKEYKKHIVLRPSVITNNHGIISRLKVIALNQAIEVDIYGNINVTHVLGSKVINGIGGSGEFARASYLSVYLLSSTTRNGKISRIVPMVTHVDIPDHDVDVIVTEVGWADLRGLSPRERAKRIIENCASDNYKDELWNYYEEACRRVGGHIPHILSKAFFMHERFMKTGTMKK